MTTTPDVIYRELLAQAQTAVTATLDTSRVTIVPVPDFDDRTMTPKVMLVLPGNATVLHPESGLGLVREEFQVCVLQKINRDQAGNLDIALSSATNSIVVLVNTLRGDGAPGTSASGLLNFQTTNAIGLCRLVGWSRVQQSQVDRSYLMWTDRYRIEYEVDYY